MFSSVSYMGDCSQFETPNDRPIFLNAQKIPGKPLAPWDGSRFEQESQSTPKTTEYVNTFESKPVRKFNHFPLSATLPTKKIYYYGDKIMLIRFVIKKTLLRKFEANARYQFFNFYVSWSLNANFALKLLCFIF